MPVFGGAMRVAVHHHARTRGAERGEHRLRRDIHDLRPLRRHMRLAAGAGRIGERLPRLERQRQHTLAEGCRAHRAAQLLVGRIPGAEQVAVGEQHAPPEERRDAGVGQHLRAGAGLEARAVEEIAVAVHHEHRHAGRRQRLDGPADAVARGVGIVVAHPGLEQVAEDVERRRLARLAAEQTDEGVDRLRCGRFEVQVRDEQVLHATIVW